MVSARSTAAVFAVFLATSSAYAGAAGELRELYRGARAQGMGNAFTAVADDSEAIFYNPAGLAGNTKSQIEYVNLNLEVSNDLIGSASDSSKAFKNLSGDSLNILMGKEIYGRAQYTPTILMKNLGISMIVDGQFALFTRNRALPQVVLGYQQTNGVQFAYGFSLSPRKKSTDELRFGVAGKVLFRRGGYHLLSFSQVLNISSDEVKQITGNYGMGIGVDLGSQYVHHFSKHVTGNVALASTDIGDTSFAKSQADPVKNNTSFGTALRYQQGLSTLGVSFDYRHLLQDTDWRKKMHLGTEVGLAMFNLYGGLNQGGFTYGAGFDLWVIKVTAVSYTEELSSYIDQNPSRRYLLNLVLQFPL